MAKSKNHTNHNQNKKDHRNGSHLIFIWDFVSTCILSWLKFENIFPIEEVKRRWNFGIYRLPVYLKTVAKNLGAPMLQNPPPTDF